MTDSRFSSEVTQAMKEYMAGNKPYVVATASVGISGLKKIINEAAMKFSGRVFKVFDTIEQAKDWLAEQ